MAKKLAITVSGAVSLGSYEAGVMYEIVHAIREHNESPDTAAKDRILIDVLTGASAGGMTAAILAQKLMFQADALEGAYSTRFTRHGSRTWISWVSSWNNRVRAPRSRSSPRNSSKIYPGAISRLDISARAFLRARITVPQRKNLAGPCPVKPQRSGLQSRYVAERGIRLHPLSR